jgi:glycerol kinase
MRTILAIDQSTSATKALLFAETGELLDKTAVAHEQIYPQPGWVEHDAEQIYRNTIDAATTLLSSKKANKKNLAGVSITNQRETFVVFDRISGEPLYNAIVWQCRRGEAICRELSEAGHEPLVQQRTGLKIDTYFPASKIRWLLDTRPDLRAKLRDGSALFGTIDTYLIYRLTGGKVYATDHTNASRTLLYDIESLEWSQQLCEVFGLEFAELPNPRESSARFGDTDLGGCIDRRIPICGVMGDSQAALFAQRCFSPGGAKVTFGSGSSVLLNIGHEKRLSASGSVTALAWVYQGQPTYAFEGIINFTGATIAWMQDQMRLIADPTETEALAQSVPSSDGVYLIPAFVGLSAPYWRPDTRAAIMGMTPSTTRAHIVRAALESIGYIVTDVLKVMSEEAGVKLSTIHADGGAVRNEFLMQFVADLNQLSLRAAKTPELSALGAVFNGGLGLNIYTSLNDLQQLPFDFVEYTSAMDPVSANNLFVGWQAAVQQVLYQPKLG